MLLMLQVLFCGPLCEDQDCGPVLRVRFRWVKLFSIKNFPPYLMSDVNGGLNHSASAYTSLHELLECFPLYRK